MKLTELKPCVGCGGPLLSQHATTWRVLRVTQGMVNPAAARQVVGLSMMFGGAMRIAEAMAPQPEKAVHILGDEEPALTTEIHVCFDCSMKRSIEELVSMQESRDECEKPETEAP